MIINLKDKLVETINQLQLDVSDIEYVSYINDESQIPFHCEFIDLLETLEDINVEIMDGILRSRNVIKDGLCIVADTWYLTQDENGSGDWVKVNIPQMPEDYEYIELEHIVNSIDVLTDDYVDMIKPERSDNPYVRDTIYIHNKAYSIESVNDIQCVVTDANEVAILVSVTEFTPIWDLGFGRTCDTQMVYHPELIKLVMEEDLLSISNTDFVRIVKSHGIRVTSDSHLYDINLKDLEVLFIPKLF